MSMVMEMASEDGDEEYISLRPFNVANFAPYNAICAELEWHVERLRGWRPMASRLTAMLP